MIETAGQAPARSDKRRAAGQLPEMHERELLEWVVLVEDRIGVSISPQRTTFLLRGLCKRMRASGFRCYGDYYRHMCLKSRHSEEWVLLADLLTVHETRFFRHGPSMELVREMAMDESTWTERGFHAWSAGCATGEEAYSLAMLIDSCRPQGVPNPRYRVTGTDMSLPSLRHARAGVYLWHRARNISEPFLEKYCRPESRTRFAINAELQKNVSFFPLNLRDSVRAPFSGLDLIFCQNLLIYYDRLRRLQIVDRLAEFLRHGGVLVLAAGEIHDWRHPSMEKVRFDDAVAYRRTDQKHAVLND